MVDNSRAVLRGRKIFWMIVGTLAVLEGGLFFISLGDSSFNPAWVVRPLIEAVLLWRVWQGKKFARVLVSIFWGLATVVVVITVLRNPAPLAILLCIVFIAGLVMLTCLSDLGAFMEAQRAREARA